MLSREINLLEYRFNEYAQYKLPLFKEFADASLNEIIIEAKERLASLLITYHIEQHLTPSFVRIIKRPVVAALFQILLNITQHAYPDDINTGKEKKILIASKHVNEYVELTITDYGKGLNNNTIENETKNTMVDKNTMEHEMENTMEDNNINFIFEPGWKENPSSVKAGLGLAFARYIIQDLHEGSINAFINRNNTTGNNEGLSITITLPMVI
jgi:signal transduction histidine kinase